MAVLTRPLFHAQERIDLEDFNQILSGLRTDSRLWSRQFISDQNKILKGFACSGEGSTSLSVSVFDGTFVLAGRSIDMNTGVVLESPGDFSFYTLESSVGPNDADAAITTQIIGGLRSSTELVIKRLYVYVRLITEEGTPITKAFWDPSANSGSGAEFNQRVNTAVDLGIEIEVVEGRIIETEDLLGRIEIAHIDVDSSGTIQSIIDTRPLLFELRDDYSFENTDPTLFVTGNVNTASGFSFPQVNSADPVTNTTSYILGEQVYFIDASDTVVHSAGDIDSSSFLLATVTNPDSGDRVNLELDALETGPGGSDIAPVELQNVSARKTQVVGVDSGAIRLIEDLTHSFARFDKGIDNIKEMFDSVVTEIKAIKGTPFWYSDPGASVLDVLRFINSTIVAESPTGRYTFSGGNLTISNDIGFCSLGSVVPGLVISNLDTDAQTFEVTTALVLNVGEQILVNNATDPDAFFTIVAITPGGLTDTITYDDLFGILADGDTLVKKSDYDTNSECTANSGTWTQTGNNSDDIAAVRVFGFESKFLLSRQDSGTNVSDNGRTGTEAEDFVVDGAISLADNEVLYITLPDLNASDYDDTIDYRYSGYIRYQATDGTNALINANRDYWNANNPIFGELLNPSSDNSFVGTFKVVPVDKYVHDDRNYWIAFRESDTSIHIRDIGLIGQDELVPISSGVTNQTLSFIGAPDENTSIPMYPALSGINSFSADGAYTTGAGDDYNDSFIGATDNLTEAIDILNNNAVALKDQQYQNLGIKLVAGGLWTLTTATTLTNGEDAFVQVPGLPDTANRIAEGSIPTLSNDGDVIFVDINRISTGSAADVANIDSVGIDSFVPQRDRFIIARRLGEDVYVGIFSTTRLSVGDCSAIDGELAFFGFVDGQLPKQLKLSPLDDFRVAIASSDVEFRTGKDDNEAITLALSIGTGLLSFEGAILDFSGITGDFLTDDPLNPGTDITVTFPDNVGKILDSTGLRVFRDDTVANSQFSLNAPASDEAAWYSIGLVEGVLIEDVTDPDRGRIQGNIEVAKGANTTRTDVVPYAEFAGDVPIGQVNLINVAGTFTPLDDEHVIQLGSSGSGGGGGTGDASQALNNLLNRLNLSIFEFLTPVVASVTEQRELINAMNSSMGVGIGSEGFGVLAGFEIITEDLLDPEFSSIDERLSRIEVIGIWQTDEGNLRIDPNAQWFVTRDSAQASPDLPLTEELKVTITDVDSTANTLQASNHQLSFGHRVNFISDTDLADLDIERPLGSGSDIEDNNYYVEVIDLDTIALHPTRVEADAQSTGTRIAVDGTNLTGDPVLTRRAGVIDRVGITDTMRVAYTFSDSNPATQELKIRVLGDEDAGTQNQTDEGLLSAFGVFYRDEVAETGVEFRSLDSVNEVLRSNHLHNEYDTNASYAVAGRGIQLFDTNGDTKELSISADDKLRIDGTELSTGHIIEDSTGTDLDERANLQFIGATVTDDSANDRTVVTVGSAVRLTQTGGTNTSGDGESAASQSSFHWIAPAGVFSIKLWLTSAGGTGGVGPNPTARPGGGAGGGTIITTLQVVEGERYELLIGDDNPGISDAGGSNRGGRNGGATVFRSPSGSTTALIDGKNREVLVSGGSGGGRSGAGATSDGGRFSSGTNTGTIDTTSSAVNFQVEVNAIGGRGSAANISPGNNSPGGGSFYENGGALAQHDGNERGSGGAGFLGFPGSESSGGAGSGGRGGVYIEYFGPASIINSGLTP